MSVTWDCIAQFGTSGAWGAAGNWPTGGVPLAGEHALIPAINQAITGSDQSAADLGTVWFDRLNAHKAGSSGSALIFASNLVVVQGTAEKHIGVGGNGVDYMIIDCNDANQEVVVYPSGTNNLLGVLFAIRGRVTIAAEAGRITRGVIGPQARLLVSDGAGGFDELQNDGGLVESNELITKLYNNAGETTQVYGSGASVTNAYCKPGSVFNYDMAGTIAFLDAKAGAVVDFARNSQNKTVTASLIEDGAIVRTGAHVSMTPLYGEA